MNQEDHKIAIQNVHGRFAQYFTAKRFDLIPTLFSSHPDVTYVCPDDHVEQIGPDAVAAYFTELAHQSIQQPKWSGMLPLMNNPVVRIDSPTEAKGCWTAHCYLIIEGENGPEIEYGIRRYDADFVLEDGSWKYRKLHSFYFSSFVPMAFDPDFESAMLATGAEQQLPPALTGLTEAADYLELQQLQSLYSHNRRAGALELFSEREDISFHMPSLLPEVAQGRDAVRRALETLDQMDEANEGRCVSIPMLESPVIEVQPDGTAAGAWHVICHEIQGGAHGHTESYCPVYTRICRFLVTYVKENGIWKILHFRQEVLMTLPPFRYDKEASRPMCMESPGVKWMDPPAPTGFAIRGHEADVLEIEELIAFWTGSIRHRSFGKLVYERVAWERPDLADGKLLCRQIFGMTDSFYKEQPKYPGFHCGTTPYVQLDEDTGTAEAVWLDYGYTSLGEKFGYLRYPWHANPGIARYHIRLVKCDDVWKLYEFNWKPFFRIEYLETFWQFDYARAKGWVGSASEKRFPLPFQEYTYSEERYYPGMPGFELEPPEISCPLEVQKGLTVGYDVLARYSGYTSNRPVPRAIPSGTAKESR